MKVRTLAVAAVLAALGAGAVVAADEPQVVRQEMMKKVGGAMGAQSLGRRLGTRPALTLGMAAVLVSLLASAWPLGLAWLIFWRLLAGLAGGVLMSLAGPAVQRTVAPARRGAASGVVVSAMA